MNNEQGDRFDVVVLGTGAGGGGVASRCAKAGWRTAIVDDQPPGGTCALRGCDPKKILVGAAQIIDSGNRMAGHGISGGARIDWAELMKFKRSFTDPVPEQREQGYRDAGIIQYSGHAEFTGKNTIAINGNVLHARHVVIATGASPAVLGIDGESNLRTSTDFLELDSLPPRIAFIGAGYISFEFAHIVQRAGSQAVVLGRGQPLSQFDGDLVNRLLEHSREVGIDVRLGTEVKAVRQTDAGYRVEFDTETGAGSVDVDLVVHGGGRTPNTGRLNLAEAGVEVDERGAVRVNEFLQSVSNPDVYAAGDVVLPKGSAPLTPVGGHESAVVAHNLLHGNSSRPDYRGIPSVVFTIPALASVGMTGEQAGSQGLAVEIKSADTRSWYSARRVREPAYMFKTIVDSSTEKLLGAHLLGPHSEEVINIFALAIRNDLPVSELRHMMYAYPTSSSDVPYMV